MKRLALVLVALSVVLAGCGTAVDPGTNATPATDAPTDPDDATTAPGDGDDDGGDEGDAAPADPESDVLGWEDGYWYNESITVDRSDGLNESELDAVVARAMARVEVVRDLEFEETVPVEVISRDEYAEDTTGNEYSTADRLHQNTKAEALFMVGEDTDAIAVQEQNRAASVGGYYSPSEERIVIVSDNTSSPKMNEITLAQELFHALQDQHFDLSQFESSTQEAHNANDGIIEGDGNLVDYLYEQRCDAGEWGDCLLPDPDAGGGGGSSDLHIGLYVITFQPYSDGPNFVQEIRDDGGWEAVNDVYANPPASTEQTIHPEKYGADAPTDVTVTDTSSGDWSILEMGADSVNYAEFGEAGIASMFWYASYAESVESGSASEVVVPYSAFFNQDASGELDPTDPYDYNFTPSNGWDGDKLYPYVTDDSAATNETAFVWKTVWDTDADATEFANGYVTLLEHHGAEPVDDREDTYVLPADSEFDDAYYLYVDGDTVYVVNAPSVDDLDDVFDEDET
jgi:hypothetical protein